MYNQDSLIGKVVLVGDGISLPLGWASSSRLVNLAKAIECEGYEPEILLVRPTELQGQVQNPLSQGSINGIKYHYVLGTSVISNNRLIRRLQMFIAHFCLVFNLLKSLRNNGIGVVAYTRNMSTLMAIWLVCKISRTPLVLEMCEWPDTLKTRESIVRYNNMYFSRYAICLAGGIIAISVYIENKIKVNSKKCKKEPQLLQVPILVNVQEFDGMVWEPDNTEPYVLFSGNFMHMGTIEMVIRSYAIIHKSNPQIKLRLVGSRNTGLEYEQVTSLISELGLLDSVVLHGFVARSELLNLLKKASALLIPLFNDAQSAARFPTKIAEYLMSGCPVITTSVGEVAIHLKHGVSAYLASDDSINAFATCIDNALADQEKARVVGARGKEYAISQFDYSGYGAKIIRLIQSLGPK